MEELLEYKVVYKLMLSFISNTLSSTPTLVTQVINEAVCILEAFLDGRIKTKILSYGADCFYLFMICFVVH